MRDDSAEILFQFFFSFSAGGPCEQLWHGQGCPLFDIVHPVFPLPTTASPTLYSTLKGGFLLRVLQNNLYNYSMDLLPTALYLTVKFNRSNPTPHTLSPYLFSHDLVKTSEEALKVNNHEVPHNKFTTDRCVSSGRIQNAEANREH